jgi:hypothetical protein
LISSPRRPRAKGWLTVTAAFALAAGNAFASEATAPGWIGVDTTPAAARIWINGIDAGLSPVAPVEVPSGRNVVRAFRGDPRRFEPVADGLEADLAPGETLFVRLDLRPPILLRSRPEPASITLLPMHPDLSEVAVGKTPLRLAPGRLEGWRVRVGAYGYADSLLMGAALVAGADDAGGALAIELRSLGLPPPAPPPGPSLLGRRWFQWALIGAGTAMTAGAAILRHEGDRSYDRYLGATRPSEIERHYDRTLRYDRWASVSLGVGQVALTSGLFLFVSGIGR